MRKLTLVSALLLAGSLALTTACSSAPGGSATGPAPGGSASATAPAPATVDPTRIKGLNIVNDSSNDRTCRWATSYPEVPGATALTAAMRKDVRERLALFTGESTGGGTTGCAPDPSGDAPAQELNISFALLVASGDVVGVRLSYQEHSGVGDGLRTRTYWYDGAAGAYRPATALIADGSLDAFVAALKQELGKREGVTPDTLSPLDDPSSRAGLLDDLTFTADGGLRVAFDRSDIGVPAGGRYTVDFGEGKVTRWLSGFGERVRAQTLKPSAGLDFGAAGTPTPTVPAPSDPGADTTDCARVKCIALTFDDGPAVPETTALLRHLAAYDARATFFVVGQNVAAHRDLVRAAADAGHEIGNHSWNHPDLTRLTPDGVRSQLLRTNAAIKAATGEEPVLFRPPYGAIDRKVRAAAAPLSPVLWDVDTEDWKYRDAAKVARTVIEKAGRNDVVLLHDIHPTSVAAVPEILRTLTARGYHFVTVSRLRATLR